MGRGSQPGATDGSRQKKKQKYKSKVGQTIRPAWYLSNVAELKETRLVNMWTCRAGTVCLTAANKPTVQPE